MNIREWEETVPADLQGDSLWKVAAYRYALLASDLSWEDMTLLRKDRRTLDLSDQLYRAAGSTSPLLRRATREERGETGRAFASTPWARTAKAATGTTRRGTCWTKRLFNTASFST